MPDGVRTDPVVVGGAAPMVSVLLTDALAHGCPPVAPTLYAR
jgi:hypothetical protein